MKSFPDRRTQLFGREGHIHDLVTRARTDGVTMVVARPQMGKSWTLEEVARRLGEEASGNCIVGFHESSGTENSHFLYAVSDLYARWLNDSSMREQALSFWERYKERGQHQLGLIGRIGEFTGKLFKDIGELTVLGKGVGEAIDDAFRGLANLQLSLQTGDLARPRLPYEEALALTTVVSRISERRVVLILDAWDKAGSAFADFEILRMLLRHKSDWPASHVIVGIRHPEQNVIRSSDKAYEYAWALQRESAVAKVYELHEMNLDSPEERVRMLTDIRSEVHGARLLSDEELTKRIDGFPGAISRLKEDGFNINTAEECKNVLLAAHDLRYPEFDRLFEATTYEQKKLAARLAYFPRVSNRQWQLVRPILLAELPETSIHALIDTQILDDVSFPTYGHDARHTAARRWFVQNIPRLIRDEGSKLVRALASGLSGPNGPDLSLVGALAACSEAARETDSDSITLRLIELAHIALGRTDDSARRIEDINYQEILEDNPSTTALVSLSLLSSGNTSYQAGDTVGAIANFDLVITLPNAPVISFGPALYNRGVARALRGDTEAALADFSTVIALPNVPTDVLAMAHYNRGIAKGLGRDSVGAIEDYNTVVRLPNAPIEVVAMAVVKRGLQRVAVGDSASALADFNYVITLAGASPEQVATALVKRGIMKVSVGDSVGALADFESVIALPKAPAYLVASALHNRGTTKSSSGDPAGAIADFDTVILLPGAPADLVAQALFNRGAARGARGDLTGEIADYTAVVAMTNASVDSVAMALCNRGIAKGWSGDLTGEIADYTAVIELPNAPPQPVAKALYNRAIAKSKGRDIQGAIADCSAVITLPNAPTEQVAKALLHRGLARASGNDGAGGLSDFDAVIALPNAPTEVVSKAHLLRGLAMREQGRV